MLIFPFGGGLLRLSTTFLPDTSGNLLSFLSSYMQSVNQFHE